MAHMMVIIICSSIFFAYFFLYHIKKIKEFSMLKSSLNNFCEQIKTIEKEKKEHIDLLFKRVGQISEEKNKEHDRVIELENAINKGTGVTLRKEVTEFVGQFNETEMIQMQMGLLYCIRERYSNTDDVKFYLTLIDKIRKYVQVLQTAEQTKETRQNE